MANLTVMNQVEQANLFKANELVNEVRREVFQGHIDDATRMKTTQIKLHSPQTYDQLFWLRIVAGTIDEWVDEEWIAFIQDEILKDDD